MDGTSFVFPNSEHIMWSIMIVLYPYISGLVAGTFVVSALYHAFGQNAFKPIARLALVTSLCFCAFATTPLLLHLHHPERCFQVAITPNFYSAMAGFGVFYGLYMLLLIVEVWLVFRPTIVERANAQSGTSGWAYQILSLGIRTIPKGAWVVDQWMIRLLAIIGIPAACILTGYVGFLFGTVKANPWWSTSLMPVIFIVSAIISGFAALVLLYVLFCWQRKVQPVASCLRSLLGYLWIFLLLVLTLEMLELLQMAYEAEAEWPLIFTLLTEKLSISLGLVQILIGAVCPLFLLLLALHPGLNQRLMAFLGGLASLLVLMQVFAMRWNVIIGGQLFSKSLRGFVEYKPAWWGREGLVAATVVLCLPLVTLWFAARVLPLWEDEEHEGLRPEGPRSEGPAHIGLRGQST